MINCLSGINLKSFANNSPLHEILVTLHELSVLKPYIFRLHMRVIFSLIILLAIALNANSQTKYSIQSTIAAVRANNPPF